MSGPPNQDGGEPLTVEEIQMLQALRKLVPIVAGAAGCEAVMIVGMKKHPDGESHRMMAVRGKSAAAGPGIAGHLEDVMERVVGGEDDPPVATGSFGGDE